MEDRYEYRQEAQKKILVFCTTENNDGQQYAVALALSDMPLHTVEFLNHGVTGTEGILTIDDSMRMFVAERIITYSNESREVPMDNFYGAMWECVYSLAEARLEHGVGRTAASSSAYLKLTMESFLANDFSAPDDEQLLELIHGGVNHSYQRVRDLRIIELVDRHPEQCDAIVKLMTAHGIRHAPAIEAAITGSTEPTLVSGVL